MKAYLINMFPLVPRSRSCAKVKVKYKGYISQKMAFSGAFVFHKHILLSFQIDKVSFWGLTQVGTKVKVKYQGYIFQERAVTVELVFHKLILLEMFLEILAKMMHIQPKWN